MPYSVTNVDREFSPAEAAEITGVSTALQRDWRRRGILPERKSEGWSRFSVTDIIEMYVLRFFSDAGFFVKDVREITGAAVLPVLNILQREPGAIEIEGADISPKLRDLILAAGVATESHGRFLVIFHRPRAGIRDFALTWGRFEDLARIDAILVERDAEGCTCLDLTTIASRIIEQAALPLFRAEVEQTQVD